MTEKLPCVYILASKRNGTLYTGVTSNLKQRMLQHRNGTFEGFSKKYSTHILVYIEQAERMNVAMAREKQLKKWRRRWKLELVEEQNPLWKDLSGDL